jgi:signal transduction histidine kinase
VLLPFLAGRLLHRQRVTSARLRQLSELLDQRREADAQAAMLAERARIAREVHDVVAHSVGVMVVQAGVAEELADVDPDAARKAMATVRGTGRDALTELRRLLGLMVPDADTEALRPQPGLAELATLLEQVRAAGQQVDACVSGDGEVLSPGVDLAAYRVVQEGLTNARKHASGRPVDVLLRGGPGTRLRIDISNPIGAGDEAPVVPGSGLGLVGLTERVRLAGGQLDHQIIDEEFRLSAWLPWPA